MRVLLRQRMLIGVGRPKEKERRRHSSSSRIHRLLVVDPCENEGVLPLFAVKKGGQGTQDGCLVY